MERSKRIIAVVFCCVSLVAKPVSAFWPVFDMGEIIPVVSNISNGLDAISQTKKQLEQLNAGLRAIGDATRNLAQFAHDLASSLTDIANIVDDSVSILNDNLGMNITAQESLTNGLRETSRAQNEAISGLVAQTDMTLGKSQVVTQDVFNTATKLEGYGSSAISGLDKVTCYGTIVDGKCVPNETGVDQENKSETNQTPEDDNTQPGPVEEEEEEEEVNDFDNTASIREEIKIGFDVVIDENNKLAEQLNELMNTAINTLNKRAEQNIQILDSIGNVINKAENISGDDKAILQKKRIVLSKKIQNLTDKSIAIMEASKDTYNELYKEQISDGINNYEKVIEQFLRGDADIEEVREAGEKLKMTASSIDASPDAATLNNIEAEIKKMQKETKEFQLEVKNMEQKTIQSVN